MHCWANSNKDIRIYLRCLSGRLNMSELVGGFNPFEKYLSKWESSPGRGGNKKYLKPPPSWIFVSCDLKGQRIPALSHFHQGTPVLIVTVKGISTSAFSPILTCDNFVGELSQHTPWKMTVVDTTSRLKNSLKAWKVMNVPTRKVGKVFQWHPFFRGSSLLKFWGCRYLGPPKPTLLELEVLMVTNLVFRWPKPLCFMVLRARGKLWYRFATKLLSLHKYPDSRGI